MGFRQACVMSPWLFDIWMDGVVREVYARAERNGVNLVGVDGQGQGWELYQVLFADDIALVADLEDKLQKLVEKFGRVAYVKEES